MRQRIWTIRVTSVLIVTVFSLLISLLLNGIFAINYINTTFVIGLIFLVISASSYVIIAGFFRVFAEGFKLFFKKEDTSIDKSHWSYDIESQNNNNELNLRRREAKNELFIYLPLTIGISLIFQSIIILIFT